METILIIGVTILGVSLICSSSFAFYQYGNNAGLAKLVKNLYRDKIKLQKNQDLINNRLSVRAGLGELVQRERLEEKESETARPVIVSPAESIQRIRQPQIKQQARPEAKSSFLAEAEKIT